MELFAVNGATSVTDFLFADTFAKVSLEQWEKEHHSRVHWQGTIRPEQSLWILSRPSWAHMQITCLKSSHCGRYLQPNLLASSETAHTDSLKSHSCCWQKQTFRVSCIWMNLESIKRKICWLHSERARKISVPLQGRRRHIKEGYTCMSWRCNKLWSSLRCCTEKGTACPLFCRCRRIYKRDTNETHVWFQNRLLIYTFAQQWYMRKNVYKTWALRWRFRALGHE